MLLFVKKFNLIFQCFGDDRARYRISTKRPFELLGIFNQLEDQNLQLGMIVGAIVEPFTSAEAMVQSS